MKIKDIPVEVQSVTLKLRDKAPCVVVKLRADIARTTGSAELRRVVQTHVVPRPELLDEVDLEGLDERDRAGLTPDEAERLDKLLRRRNAAVKVSCAAPAEWWDGCEVALRADDGAEPALVLRPASADGRITVEVQGDMASVTFSWSCLAGLVHADALETLGALLDGDARLDLTSDAMQLDLFDGAEGELRGSTGDLRDSRAVSMLVDVVGNVIGNTVPIFGDKR